MMIFVLSRVMSDFQVDTSGFVDMKHLDPEDRHCIYWRNLSPFEQGYTRTAFASLIEEWRHQVGFKAGDKVRVHTDEVGTVTARKTGTTKSVHVLFSPGLGGEYFPFECTPVAPGFSDLAPETLARIREDCAAYRQRLLPSDLNHARYGEGFWIDRQRAGSHFPPLTLYLGDDGKVRFQ